MAATESAISVQGSPPPLPPSISRSGEPTAPVCSAAMCRLRLSGNSSCVSSIASGRGSGPGTPTGEFELAGRYRVVRRLGSGGAATVFLAQDTHLDRRVAIKRLHTGSPADAAQRFTREAKVGASLNHPHLVTVFDTLADEESVLIVMEYVEGTDLAEAIRRR